jgi:hypothetical protein
MNLQINPKLTIYKTLIFFALIIYFSNANAQVRDSLNSKITFKKTIVPLSFIGAGVLINHSQFEQNLQTNLRNNVGNTYEFSIDDYTQYAPIAELYIADIIGIDSKNHWFDQTKYLLISQIITSGITRGLKELTLKTRPNGAPYSFPSGHTTFAFTNATVLYNEFYETSPILAYSGYAFAATTGTFRMLNNKHWLSDVLVGAGIGILVTNFVYYIEPFKDFNPFKKTQGLIFIPQVNYKNYGVYVSYEF